MSPRDTLGGRSRPDPTRVSPVEKQSGAASTAARATEDVAAELERLSREVLGNSRLSIQRETPTGDFVYLMIDKDTGETVRRWPPESLGDLVEYLHSFSAGLVNKSV